MKKLIISIFAVIALSNALIAQSAYLLNEDKKNYANVFNGYLSKPINKKEFELAVTNYIDIALLN